jgi:hypothetical protein
MVVGGTSFSATAIERAGFGQWCHMANVLADGTILDARDNEIEGIPPGVQLRPAGYLDMEPRWALFEAPSAANYDSWLAAGRGQLLKPYDERGIIDFAEGAFTGKYVDTNYAGINSLAWFCDCLCSWMAIDAGDIPQPDPRLHLNLFTLTPSAALLLFIGARWRLVDCKGL